MRARLLLLAAALAAFGASLVSGFHFDDYVIFQDRALTSPAGWLDVWSLRQTRPLTYWTFWLNYRLGGSDPIGYHAVNLALHAAAVWLAYECMRRLMPERAALLAAALFAAHPFQAEAVDYVWGRSIVLAALLCLGALWSWLEGRHWEAVAWFLGALLAKEEVAAFPLALLLLERKHRAPIAAMLGLALAAGLRVIYATAVTPGVPAGFQAPISTWNYLLAQGPALWRYFRLLIAPYGFSVDPDVRVPSLGLGLAAWALVIALAAVAWRFRGKDGQQAWGVWVLAGLLLLLPSSSIFPAADLSADRRMYFPLLAFSAAAALLLVRLKARVGRLLGPAVVVALVALSMARTEVWMTERSLWSEAVRRAPAKVRPKIQLARALPADQALEVLSQARALAPNDPAVAAETGKTLLAGGQAAQALVEFGRALALDPRDARNFNNRGVALAALGQMQAARADFERALALDPALREARENLRRIDDRVTAPAGRAEAVGR